MLLRVVIAALLVGAACSRAIDPSFADAALTAAVQTALLNDPSIDGTAVTVRATGGVVYLTGTQATPEAVERVASIVRGVQGVGDVQANITVAPAAPATTPR